MIFGPVSKYSLVNAKVRARLSTLLDPDLINKLAEAHDLAEFYAILGGTIYEDIFSRPEITFDPRVGERLLIEQEVDWHAELLKDLRGAERALVAHFLEKYEIENLKAVFRIREGSRGEEEMRYIVQRELPHAIPYQAISEAASIEDALPLLSGTPYHAAVLAVIEDFKERGTLFPIEINLEVDYYRRLKKLVQSLSKKDREVAMQLIGIEIDQKNIGWLVRLKFYYDIPLADLLDYNIPGGYRMSKERLSRALRAESLREVLTIALEKSLGRASDALIQEGQLSKLYLLEIILWNRLIAEARRSLSGFPFRIGTVLAYLILKRTEIRNIITILNGKVYRMDRGDIESHLRVSF
jgi:vacuolar-type H+-ATPase subunit C/Vma6